MAKIAVVKTGGKQYLVEEKDFLVVNYLNQKEGETTDLETLAVFSDDGEVLNLDKEKIESVKAKVIEHGLGEKIRVARFKAKVRYRRVKGFRPKLTKLQIIKI